MTHSPSVHTSTAPVSFSADRCVILLLPLTWSVYAYGTRALFITLISVFFAAGAYILFSLALKRKIMPHILLDIAVSAAVFAFTLPVSVPYYVPMLGGVIAAIPSLWLPEGRKICFGGFLSAAAVRAFFPSLMSRATQAFTYLSPFVFSPTEADINSLRTYTPLQLLGQGKVSSGTLWDQFYGTVSGNIGEISFMLLLVGCIFLIARKKLRVHGPAVFLFTLSLITLIFPLGDSEAIFFMLVSLLSGGAMLAAVFAFSDTLSTPVTDMGKIVFAVGAAVITVLIRYLGASDEGVYAAVVIMNLLTPIIDRYTLPVAYGRTKVKGGKK